MKLIEYQPESPSGPQHAFWFSESDSRAHQSAVQPDSAACSVNQQQHLPIKTKSPAEKLNSALNVTETDLKSVDKACTILILKTC